MRRWEGSERVLYVQSGERFEWVGNEWVTIFCDQHDGGGGRDGKYQYKKWMVCVQIFERVGKVESHVVKVDEMGQLMFKLIIWGRAMVTEFIYALCSKDNMAYLLSAIISASAVCVV